MLLTLYLRLSTSYRLRVLTTQKSYPVQSFDLAFGQAHVLYPESIPEHYYATRKDLNLLPVYKKSNKFIYTS
jgi:hypothetical protein